MVTLEFNFELTQCISNQQITNPISNFLAFLWNLSNLVTNS